MTEPLEPLEPLESPGPSQGFKQVLALVLLTGAVVILSAVYVIQRELAKQREAMKWTVAEFGLSSPTYNRLNSAFADRDHDLIADAPLDEAEWIVPEKLVFSYIAGTEIDKNTALWRPLTEAIAAATGREVVHRPLDSLGQQILELRTCRLHITAMNTGSVPRAVNTCGFVPVCTLGDENGNFGVTTKILVPKKYTGVLRDVPDLKKRQIVFTSADSNSGFKAPIVILNNEFGMQPGIDYDYGFSTSHEESIRMIRSGSKRVGGWAAPVVSDMLERALADGDIEEDDYRIIYESARFPPAAFGYLYCLHPDIVGKIRETLIAFDLSATKLGEALGAQQLVTIDYKNDWALIRSIDNALGVVHEHDTSNLANAADASTPPSPVTEADKPTSADDLDQRSQPEATTTSAEVDSADPN